MSLHRHACFTKLPWKLLSQCHGLWCGTGLPYTPDTNISWFRTLRWCPNELIQKPPLDSDCVHTETRLGSECDREQARSIANERDSQEISKLKLLSDWTYELQSDTKLDFRVSVLRYYNCKWWPTICNYFDLFIYLFLICSTCFGRRLRPSSGALDCIYSIWYCPPVLLLAGVMNDMEPHFHLIHDTSRQQCRWTISDTVNTVMCSWWWAKTSPETCRVD